MLPAESSSELPGAPVAGTAGTAAAGGTQEAEEPLSTEAAADDQVPGAPPVAALPARPAPLPTVGSPDGRLVLSDDTVTVLGQPYALRGLERADVQHVRWVLWILLGGLGLAAVLIAFLQNWLHTLPASAGVVLTATLLAYGQRGANRLRLWQLSPSPLHFALPGDLDTWQRLVAELNRRIARAHALAAAQAAALLAAAEAARAEAEAAAAQTTAGEDETPADASDPSLPAPTPY